LINQCRDDGTNWRKALWVKEPSI